MRRQRTSTARPPSLRPEIAALAQPNSRIVSPRDLRRSGTRKSREQIVKRCPRCRGKDCGWQDKDTNDVEYRKIANIRAWRAHRESPRLRGYAACGTCRVRAPKDRANAVAVLREAVAHGVNHIDT